jgi:hypothetical protein
VTETRLKEALGTLAEQARVARVAPGTWQRGRRRRLSATAAASTVTVVALLAAVAFVLTPSTVERQAGQARPVVPAVVYPPFTFQFKAVSAPPGPAAVLVAGDHELRGSDVWGWEGRSLVVGRNGSYRLVRTVGESDAGISDLILSPDGRYIASTPSIEGTQWPSDPRMYSAVLDLTTGKVKLYPGGLPLAFAPGSKTLLVRVGEYSVGGNGNRLGPIGLLDLGSGAIRPLADIDGNWHPGNVTAFSPDGSLVAVASKTALHIIETATGAVRRVAPLSVHDRLAGPGAWLPDGRRIALYTVQGCGVTGGSCSEDALNQRRFQVRYLDAETGAADTGPALADANGIGLRMLGWQADGDAVVAVYRSQEGQSQETGGDYWSETGWWEVGGVELREFRLDGAANKLIELPDSALFVDVPAELLDSFGGPAPSRVEGAVRQVLATAWPVGQIGVLLALGASWLLGRGLWRRLRGRRVRRHRWEPVGIARVGED